MVENKKKWILYIVLFATIFISGCTIKSSEFTRYQEGVDTFYKVHNVTDHIPNDSQNTKNMFFYSLSHEVNFSEFYITVSAQIDDINLLESMKYHEVGYYKSKNYFQINIDLIRDSLNLCSADIKEIDNMIPIGNFEQYDFGLGEYSDSIYSKIDSSFHKVNKNSVPEDLKVYVIEAVPGDYFVSNILKTKRYSKLGIWKNGYSRGVAISEKEKSITYWLVIW